MRILVFILCATLTLVAVPQNGVRAQPFDPLDTADFDARGFSDVEKRFLQAALAFEGDYNGLLDGSWGRGSQSALEAYTWREFGREPSNSDGAFLGLQFSLAIDMLGWRYVEFPLVAYAMMMPNALRRAEKDWVYEHWNTPDGYLDLYINDLNGQDMISLHNAFEASVRRSSLYTVRRNDFFVTSGESDGIVSYARSDLIAGTWSTVTVHASVDRKDDLNLIVSSVSTGPAPTLLPSDDGPLMRRITALASVLSEEEENDERQIGVAKSSGSGFHVSPAVLVTNHHVIEECSQITVDGEKARIFAMDPESDLAAIILDTGRSDVFLPLASDAVRLNSDITVSGFPLYGMLGGMNVTRGAVTALKGLGGDEAMVQISAPVQSGNSGGPMVDRHGHVVGVVTAKLDAFVVAKETGDLAQNVNFAVRGSKVRDFLSMNGVAFEMGSALEPPAPEDLAEILAAATRLIVCE